MTNKKMAARPLSQFEAKPAVGQQVLDGVQKIKAGRGTQASAEVRSPIVQARLKSGLKQDKFAALLGVSKRTLEQWEQGRRAPRGAAKTLINVAELYPNVLREVGV